MKPRFHRWTVLVVFACTVHVAGGQQPQQEGRPTFKSVSNLVRVDVIVRDRNGVVVRDLRADDFVVTEDGKPQAVLSFAFEDASSADPPESVVAPLLTAQRLRDAAKPSVARAVGNSVAEPVASLTGRRVMVMLFDTSAMDSVAASRALQAATTYVRERLSQADAVAVATVGQSLNILADFTSDPAVLLKALAAVDVTSGTGFEQPNAAEGADLPLDSTEFAVFNNDRRLRALRVLATALAPLEQRKAILYFSSGLTRSGSDNQVELRAAINAASRANVSIYPVDSRGLMAIAPGGEAAEARAGEGDRGGTGAFSGAAVVGQLGALSTSQETLTTLAADTGGEVFADTNNFAPAFARVQSDLSGYYLLGYSSTNAASDGRFRRLAVKLRNTLSGDRIEARSGYYAETSFANLKRSDRERQLQDQISSAISATEVPVVSSTAWFRLADGKYYVPISVAVPGSVLRAPATGTSSDSRTSLDVLGVFLDERGREVGRLRDTVEIPQQQLGTLADRPLQYQSGVTLPPGLFRVKVVVRENVGGAMGSFEFQINVPDVQASTFRVSPIVFGTQLRALADRAGTGANDARGSIDSQRRTTALWSTSSPNPLVREGQELVQSLNHVVAKGQPMYFYYEVYNPMLLPNTPSDSRTRPVHVRSNVACYSGTSKVIESSMIERSTIDDTSRNAVLFRLQLPTDDLGTGVYACQVNVIDVVSGTFEFPRVGVYVR